MESDISNAIKSILISLCALENAVSKSHKVTVEEKVIKDYHINLEKIEKILDRKFDEARITEQDIEYENGEKMGFLRVKLQDITSTTTISEMTDVYQEEKYYNKTLFLKKINVLILILNNFLEKKSK